MGLLAKSIIVDIADNWGASNNVCLRSIDFYIGGSLIDLAADDITCYATTHLNSSYAPNRAFITSLPKIGPTTNGWASSNYYLANQRLICVFDTDIKFDQIVVNNSHHYGIATTQGAKTVMLYVSTDAITDTTYGAEISNSFLLYDGQFDEHSSVDDADPQEISLIQFGIGVLTGTVAISSPAVSQVHSLTAISVLTGSPVVPSPFDIIIHAADEPFGLDIAASGTLHSMATMVVPGHVTSALAFSGAFNSNPFPPMTVGVSLLEAKSGVEFDTGGVHNIYLCCLTGYQNGLDELLVPISSFQCTLRVDDPSYLQVVTPAVEYADEIAARTDGEIRVVMCQVKNGKIINQEQIVRVSMGYVSVDEGTSNKSVTLSGYSEPEGAAQKTVTLENSTYKRLLDGTTTLRFPEPNIYLRPGDTVVSGSDQIKVDKITLYMSVSRQQMEVSGG